MGHETAGPLVLVTARMFGSLSDEAPGRLRAAGCRVRFPAVRSRPTQPNEMPALLEGVEIVIAGIELWTDQLMASAPGLRLICRFGAGVDSVDINAATHRGILVASTPGLNHAAVAEHAFALMLAVMRRVASQDAHAKRGEWIPTPGPELQGRTLGIVGLGRIGRAAAKIALAFGMRVIATEIAPDREFAAGYAIDLVDLADLLAQADVVSLHVPLTSATRHVINADAIARMRPGAYVINTSRGGLIDEVALRAALASGRLAGAGLDVTDPEPPVDWRLAQLPQVVVTPHVAGLSTDAIALMETSVIETTLAVLQSERPATLLNPGAVPARRR